MQRLAFWLLHYENLRDGWRELRRSSTAWGEMLMACAAVTSGAYVGWPFFRPYESARFPILQGELALYVGLLFLLCGLYQGLIAYFGHREVRVKNIRLRADAAIFGAGLWGGTFYVLYADAAPGWMTAIAPTFMLFEVAMFARLLRSRRKVDAL